MSTPVKAPKPGPQAKTAGTQAAKAQPARPKAPRPAPPLGAPAAAPVLTGAQAVVRALEELEVEAVFGIPGGAILPAYDPLLDSEKVRHILVRHEQGAGHAAQGYALATGRVGVCMATSGPGATNLVTPLADAHMDSVPIVAITGQVASTAIGTDAFQEADIVGITMPITKHSYLVTTGEEIPRVLAEAFHVAATGRPGPVLVDIPKDILSGTAPFVWPPKMDLPGYRPTTQPHGKQIREAAALIAEARRPVLYVGGGVVKSGAHAELRELAELTGAPVITTLMARGAFPTRTRSTWACPGCTARCPPSTRSRSPTSSSPWARASTTASPASSTRSRPRRRSSTSTSTPPRSARTAKWTSRSWATARPRSPP
nr:hypothetical protein GCM10025732_53030 [Glycomyces mayteni]